MAGINEDDIRKVREASDIVTVFSERVPLRQRGRDFWCCCPFHDERSPSCKIDPAAQLWHCFGCGAGGDVFSFMMRLDDLDFPDAVRRLAERAGIALVEDKGVSGAAQGYKLRLMQVCKEAALFYHQQLMRGKHASAAAARDYLKGRGLGGKIPKEWQLGFAAGNTVLVSHLRKKGFRDKELLDANVALTANGALKDRFFNRVIFPICDAQGEAIAFGGRIIGEGQPKYLNSQETPLFHKSEVLYGLDKAKSAMAATGVALVVEGYTDVIALHSAGLGNAVATLGTALTGRHIQVLSRHARNRIVYLFDGDAAGQRAAERALEFIDERITPEAGRSRIELAAVTLPDGLDPADFVAAKGSEALKGLVEQAPPLIAYGIARRLAGHDLATAEGRAYALNDALSILAPIKSSLLAKDYAIQIAGQVRAREEDVLERLAQLKAPQRPDRLGQKPYQAVPEPRPLPGTALPADMSGQVADLHATPDRRTASRQSSLDEFAQTERNRRRFETEFLSLCACEPEMALTHANVLVQTKWHGQGHAPVAQALVDALAKDPTIPAADLVRQVQERIPGAESLLTSGSRGDSGDRQRLAAFLAEELSIGDMEEEVASLRTQLERPAEPLSPQEQEILFASVVAAQKDLNRRRREHKPLIG